jgi:predicted MFS family arabinose efflux permease
MLLVGGLAIAGLLNEVLLVIIAAISSVTGPLSQTGLRSLFPLMTPKHLWERVNALDSSGYVVATIIGPPAAAVLVALFGPRVAVMAIGIPYLIAALVLAGVREPPFAPSSSGRLLRDAWEGLRYVWGNHSLRGLGFSISTLNIAGGMGTIAVPLIVLDHLGGSEALVGLVFALSGVAGVLSVAIAGRIDSRRREWQLLVIPMIPMAPVTLLMLVAADATDATLGYLALGGCLVILGLLNGPMDIGLFTMRQRRTDPALLGRAFAVSMAFNFLGYPVGAAIAGALATTSIDAAIWLGVAASALAAVFAAFMVPRQDPATEARSGRAGPGQGAGEAAGAGSGSGIGTS